MGTLGYLRSLGHDHSWFILTQKNLKREFALSGSTQNATDPVEAFKSNGADFLVANTLEDLVQKMNILHASDTPIPKLDFATLEKQIQDRDRFLKNPFGKDCQINYIRSTRKHIGDKLIRTAKPHAILDPKKT